MQATDFQANTQGNLDSGRALYLAESGAEWALNRLSADSSCRSQTGLLRCPPLAAPPIDSDCNDAGDWLTNNHNLSPGQYDTCVRNPVSGTENGDAVIEARGYVPSEANSDRTMRQIKIEADLGSLSNVLQTQAADPDVLTTGLFDWSKANNQPPVAPLHTVQIEGSIEAGHYEADNDGTPDELGQDYDPPPAPLLPNDSSGPSNDPRNFSASFPSIDMGNFYALTPAANRWPSNNLQTFPTQIDSTSTQGGNYCIRVAQANFFSGMDEQVVYIDSPTWFENDDNWRRIESVGGPNCCAGFAGGRCARVDPTYSAAWTPGTSIKLARRIASDSLADGLYYTGRTEEAGGSTADMLIDVRDPPEGPGSLNGFENNHFICEGNIVIKGDNQLRMRFNPPTTIYPMLATKIGNIISKDSPSGGTETNRVNQRQIAGLIYSELGLVDFNYLRYPLTGGGGANYRRNLVYGKQINLDGRIRLRYGTAVSPSGGFVFKPSTLSWREK